MEQKGKIHVSDPTQKKPKRILSEGRLREGRRRMKESLSVFFLPHIINFIIATGGKLNMRGKTTQEAEGEIRRKGKLRGRKCWEEASGVHHVKVIVSLNHNGQIT